MTKPKPSRDFLKFDRMPKLPSVTDYIESKIKWLLWRNERYNAKPGGLGKK